MDYQTAKALKDAGFPQPYGNRVDGSERIFYFENGKYVLPFSVIKDICYENGFVIDYARELVYIPTLEELIEACGDGFWSLTRHARGTSQIIWQTNWKEGIGGDTAGKDPKEAVARLYLALHGNKDKA